MKQIFLLFSCSLYLLVLTGCQTSASDNMSPGSMEVIVEGGGEFPEFLAGKWDGGKSGWAFVFDADGTIPEARIAMGRTKIIPGKVTVLETYGGGTSGIINGDVAFCDGLASEGDYEARLFFKNSYNVEAAVEFSVGLPSPPSTKAGVKPSTKSPSSIAADKPVYEVNEPIVVDFSGASGNYQDWVGLYEKGAANDKYIDWFYTDGAKSGKAVYIPGDWSVIYSSDSRELIVKIVMNYISINMGNNVLQGKAEHVLTGPVSEDGTTWWVTVHSIPEYEGFPNDPDDLPYISEVIFEKVEGKI